MNKSGNPILLSFCSFSKTWGKKDQQNFKNFAEFATCYNIGPNFSPYKMRTWKSCVGVNTDARAVRMWIKSLHTDVSRMMGGTFPHSGVRGPFRSAGRLVWGWTRRHIFNLQTLSCGFCLFLFSVVFCFCFLVSVCGNLSPGKTEKALPCVCHCDRPLLRAERGERKWSFVNDGSGEEQKTNFTTLFPPACLHFSLPDNKVRMFRSRHRTAGVPVSLSAVTEACLQGFSRLTGFFSDGKMHA